MSNNNSEQTSLCSAACTCSIPSSVNVTPWFPLQEDDDTYKVSYHCTDSEDENDQQQRLVLYSNLSRYGWSMIELDARAIIESTINNNTGKSYTSLLQQRLQWKSQLRQLFEEEEEEEEEESTYCSTQQAMIRRSNRSNHRIVFRTAESGAAGSASTEPKLSWEYKVCSEPQREDKILTLQDNTEQDGEDDDANVSNVVETSLESWAQLLHHIAMSVRRMLRLPSHVLLWEPNHKCASTTESSSSYSSQIRLQEEKSHCLDLLRAFYYYPKKKKENDADDDFEAGVLGSSPHTDWGSLTIVYQDSVGGLQTYCKACDQWNDVPTTKDKYREDDDGSHVVRFVVHVGDMTSLAILTARQRMHMAKSAAAESSQADATNTRMSQQEQLSNAYSSSVCFPSPKHRVLSPTGADPRVSLVYFCYPPANVTLDEISKELQHQWKHPSDDQAAGNGIMDDDNDNEPVSIAIPYEDYSLLENQSTTCSIAASTDNRLSKRVQMRKQFESILHLPIEKVVSDKWKQVQR